MYGWASSTVQSTVDSSSGIGMYTFGSQASESQLHGWCVGALDPPDLSPATGSSTTAPVKSQISRSSMCCPLASASLTTIHAL